MIKNFYFKLFALCLMATCIVSCSKNDDDLVYQQPTEKPDDSSKEDPKEEPGEDPGEDPGEEPGENPDDSGNGNPSDDDNKNRVGITLKPELMPFVGSSESGFERNDDISLFAVLSDGTNVPYLKDRNNIIHNSNFYFDGRVFTSDPPTYKNEGDGYAYYAVYPYSNQAGASFNFSVATNQSYDDAYRASDLCTAKTNYTNVSQPSVTFYHRMTKVAVLVEGMIPSDLDIELASVQTQARVDLNNLSFEGYGNRNSIQMNQKGISSYNAIIPPQTIEKNSDVLYVFANGRNHVLKAGGNIEAVSGQTLTIKLKINNGSYTIDVDGIEPDDNDHNIENVIPDDVLDDLIHYIDVYYGTTPPNVEGCYLIDPFVTVYCQDQGHGGYYPGDIVVSNYILFRDQDMVNNTINISELDAKDYSTYSIGNGAFISGSGNNFSAFFTTEGKSRGIYTKTALLISGTKTSSGISNLHYAFVMVEKGYDPNHYLMDEGVFRVFKDQDGLSVNAKWPEDKFPLTRSVNIGVQQGLSDKIIYYKK